MNKMTGFIGMAMLLVTTSCVSAEKVVEQDDSDALEPYHVRVGPVTAQDVEASLKRARRVVILFENYLDDEGNTIRCPVKVRTVDNVCNDPDYQNTDPSVVCRRIGDAGSNSAIQKIKWVSADDPFTVTFPNMPTGDTPCKVGWDGGTEEKKHECEIKSAADLNLGAGAAIYLKYNIEAKGCDPLDPYFIIRK